MNVYPFLVEAVMVTSWPTTYLPLNEEIVPALVSFLDNVTFIHFAVNVVSTAGMAKV